MRNYSDSFSLRRLLALAALGALALCMGPAALAAGPETAGWWSNPEVVKQLQLTDEQIHQIEALIYDSGDLLIDLKATLGKSALKLDRLLRAETLDDDAVQSTIDQLADAKCAIERAQLMARYQVARVLNAEQREQIRRFLEKNKHERKARRERIDRRDRRLRPNQR